MCGSQESCDDTEPVQRRMFRPWREYVHHTAHSPSEFHTIRVSASVSFTEKELCVMISFVRVVPGTLRAIDVFTHDERSDSPPVNGPLYLSCCRLIA